MAKTHIGNWIIELDDETGGLRVERFGKPGRVNIEAMSKFMLVEVTERGGGKRGHYRLDVPYDDVTPLSIKRNGNRDAYSRDEHKLSAQELSVWSMQRVK